MRKILALFSVSLVLMATASAIPFKPNSDQFILGRGANAINKLITVDVGDGGSNPALTIDAISKTFVFNKSLTMPSMTVTATKTFGDGTGVDRFETFDIGLGGSNPYWGWSNTSNALVFNNGLSEQKFGSGTGGGGGGINFLANPSFEDTGSPILNWINSGGTFSQETHTNGRDGNEKFARFISSGASQYFESDLITISDDVNGGCMADFKFNQGDGVFQYQVLTQSATITSTATVSDVSEFLKAPSLTFPCEGGDQFKLRIISTGAGTIDVDEAYLGSNKGFIDVDALNKFTANFDGPGVKQSESGNASFTCPKTGTGIYDCDLTDLALTAQYSFVVVGENNANTAVCAGLASTRTLTFMQVVCWASPSGTAIDTPFSVEINKQGVDAAKTLPAFVPEQADFYISANIGGANIAGGASATPVTFSDAGLDMALNDGSARIPCSGTNPSSGLTCSAGNEVVGINFNAPRSGSYKVCFSVNIDTVSNGTFRIAETGNADEIISQEGNANGIITGAGALGRVCERFAINSSGEKTFRLFYEANGTINLKIDRDATLYERDINITVELAEHNVSRPIIQNMVDTSYKSGARTNSCCFNYSTASPTIQTESGLCESWIDSVSEEAQGIPTVTLITGTYSRKPVCTITTDRPIGNPGITGTDISGSTSSFLRLFIDDSTSADARYNFCIKCDGAR